MADGAQLTTGSASDSSTGSPVEHIIADAKEMGADLLAAVRSSANSMFEEQRTRAADEISALGDALHSSAQSLEENGNSTAAHYASEASRRVADFGKGLRDRSWGELAGDVEDFARRWPLAFMAAAVGAGFAAGRFLASSSSRNDDETASKRRVTTSHKYSGTTQDSGISGTA